MDPPGDRASPRVVFLFTSFPVLSETFLQREMRVLQRSGLPMERVSLWGGEKEWDGLPVETNGLLAALASFFWLPYWLVREPRTTLSLLSMLWRPRPSGLLNWAENLLGAGYALRAANCLKRSGVTHLHAVWASAPAMAALALHRLTGIPFSFGGHAYDLFENGGDGWLAEKIPAAAFVRTSTLAGRRRFLEKGASADAVMVIRRGLPEMPPKAEIHPIVPPYRLISVGRMVEKMGFDRQIPVLSRLKEQGLPFSMVWIGDGPERPRLEQAVRDAGLADTVAFRGRLPYAEVENAYATSDLFFFTGRIDRRGDRAGLPNALAEAMAWGLLVFSTDVGATSEAIEDRENGILWSGDLDPEIVIYALQAPEIQKRCRVNARRWIEENYDLNRNLGPLIAHLEAVTFQEPAC